MPFLEVRELTKSWSNATAVNNISFQLEQKQFKALLGPSGCGKSTTLNMVAGLEMPTSGQIFIDGKDVSHKSPGQRGLSMVFQSYALFPHLTAAENIEFGLKARKVPARERKQRLQDALDLVNLQEVAQQKPSQLSGGQCQRVALARAVVSQAPLCLMDEPLSNLDAKLRNYMRSEIRALQQKLGLAVLYVTHDQIEAMSMADEIILLNGGRIEQQGSPNELYERPQTVFAAGFIGSPPMNLLITSDEKHWLGIRSTHIVVDTQQMGDGYAAKVLFTDYHGVNTLITLDLAGQSINVSRPGHYMYAPGETLYLHWLAEHEHYFRRDNGQRCTPSSKLSLLKQQGITI